MDNKQFRLGNLLQTDDGGIVEVIALWGNGNFEVHSQDFQFGIMEPTDDLVSGIRLKRGKVLELGFKEVPHRIGTIGSFKYKNIRINMSTSCNFYYGLRIVPHVHDLQNLIFALTGEELTIKE